MTWTSAELTAMIGAWLWPFFRIGAMLSAAPLFGTNYVPARARLGLALALTVAIAPGLAPAPAVDPFSGTGLLVSAQQVVVGLAMGFALRLVFVVFELMGQVIAQTMGLGFASMVDPQSGAQVPVVSQLYMLLGMLVFLSLNGHLLMFAVLAESFRVLPVAAQGLGRESFWALVAQAGWVFSAAVVIALPALAALLLVNLAFGVMTRAAPQLNIFAVGFPVTLMVGFVVMLLTVSGAVDHFAGLFDQGLTFTRNLAAGAP